MADLGSALRGQVEDRRNEVPTWTWDRLFDPAAMSASPFANSYVAPGSYWLQDLPKESLLPTKLSMQAGAGDVDMVRLQELYKILGMAPIPEQKPIRSE